MNDRLNPPAIVREVQHALGPWLAQQGAGLVALDAQIGVARDALECAERVLHESGEWRDLDAAKERLKDAKKAAVERDHEVSAEADNVKAARKALKSSASDVVTAHKRARANVKALVGARDDAAREIVKAVAAGKVL